MITPLQISLQLQFACLWSNQPGDHFLGQTCTGLSELATPLSVFFRLDHDPFGFSVKSPTGHETRTVRWEGPCRARLLQSTNETGLSEAWNQLIKHREQTISNPGTYLLKICTVLVLNIYTKYICTGISWVTNIKMYFFGPQEPNFQATALRRPVYSDKELRLRALLWWFSTVSPEDVRRGRKIRSSKLASTTQWI